MGLQGGALGLEGGKKGEGAEITENEYGGFAANVTPRRGSIL